MTEENIAFVMLKPDGLERSEQIYQHLQENEIEVHEDSAFRKELSRELVSQFYGHVGSKDWVGEPEKEKYPGHAIHGIHNDYLEGEEVEIVLVSSVDGDDIYEKLASSIGTKPYPEHEENDENTLRGMTVSEGSKFFEKDKLYNYKTDGRRAEPAGAVFNLIHFPDDPQEFQNQVPYLLDSTRKDSS